MWQKTAMNKILLPLASPPGTESSLSTKAQMGRKTPAKASFTELGWSFQMGGHFFNIVDPHPNPSLKKGQKVGFKSEGLGDPDQSSFGDAFIGQNNDFTRGKPTIQPLGVGYANRPKRSQNKVGMWRFPIHGPAWL